MKSYMLVHLGILYLMTIGFTCQNDKADSPTVNLKGLLTVMINCNSQAGNSGPGNYI